MPSFVRIKIRQDDVAAARRADVVLHPVLQLDQLELQVVEFLQVELFIESFALFVCRN